MPSKRRNIDTEDSPGPQHSNSAAKKRRVSSRLTTRKHVSFTEPDQNPLLDERPKARKRVRRGPVVGRLAGLMELPMDILFEIFGHLNPLDVLRLARTTKQFRSMLMHKSSRFIWIAARKNISDLPDCPPYMSEPQFANLVFDTHCHECLAPNTRSVDWRIGRRICMKCAKDCLVEDYPFSCGESVYKSVPSKEGKRGRLCYYKNDLNDFQRKRDSYTNPEDRAAFVKERRNIVSEMEKHAALLTTWSNNQYNARSEERDDLRRERKQAIIEELTKLGWGDEIEKIPSDDDLGHQKLVKQPTRLTPRIWSNIKPEMIRYMEQMKVQRLERERKALVIARKQIAVSVLRDYKRVHLPFSDIMPEPVDFCAFLQVSEIVELPTETEVTEESFQGVVSQMDELVAQWRRSSYDMLIQQFKEPLSRKIHQGLDAQVQPLTDTGTSSAMDPKGKGKAKAIEPCPPEGAELVEVLSLATTVFCCKTCNPSSTDFYDWSEEYESLLSGMLSQPSMSRSPLFYPEVLGHRCLTKKRGYRDDIPGDVTKQLYYPAGFRTKWSCIPLQIDDTAKNIASKIVEACGLDPLTTTTVQMDTLNPKLACLECVTWDIGYGNQCQTPVFGWRAAVDHCARMHRYTGNVKWKYIDESLADEVEDVNDLTAGSHDLVATLVSAVFGSSVSSIGLSANGEDAIWLCTHCLDLPQERECMGLSKIKSHVSNTHGVEGPEENRDYYQDYAAPQESSSLRHPKLKVTLSMERPVTNVDLMSDSDYSDYSDDFDCLCDMCGGYHFNPFY
ncbi:hypothetical protein J3A83DRAFT_4243270 [Scleroderma citrinum]